MAFITVEKETGIKSIHQDKVVTISSYATEAGGQVKVSYDNGLREEIKDFPTLGEAMQYHRGLITATSPSNFLIGLAMDRRVAAELGDDDEDPATNGGDETGKQEPAPVTDPPVDTPTPPAPVTEDQQPAA